MYKDRERIFAVVIDNGSRTMKVGLAQTYMGDFPVVFRTMVGYPKDLSNWRINKIDWNDVYIGEEAESIRSVLKLCSPIEGGIVTNWDAMEKIWHHTFYNELRVDPSEQPVLLSEPLLNPKVNRERMTQIMFEEFKVPALYVCMQAVLALYGTGTSTGCVLDCGESVSHSIAVYEGYGLPHTVMKVEIGGQHINEFLSRILTENGYFTSTPADQQIVRKIKEKMGYVALDFDEEMSKAASLSSEFNELYELENGSHVEVGDQRFRCAELLFQPNLNGIKAPGVHECVIETIMKFEEDKFFQKDLFSNIVLAGGTTLFKGFEDRLTKELKAKAPLSFKSCINVDAPSYRELYAWGGGRCLASRPGFQDMWITASEYDESGPSIVHRKCF